MKVKKFSKKVLQCKFVFPKISERTFPSNGLQYAFYTQEKNVIYSKFAM